MADGTSGSGSGSFLGNYGNNFFAALKGVGGGFTSVALGFLIIYFTSGTTQYSKVVAALPLTPVESVTASQTGLVKITGKPVLAIPLVAPKATTAENVIYYKDVIEEYRKVEQVTTSTASTTSTSSTPSTSNGQTAPATTPTETKTWIDVWVPTTEPVAKWANFKLGNVSITPNGSEMHFNYKEVYNVETPITNPNATVVSQITYNGKSANAYPATKTREIVTAVPADQQLIVIGELSSGSISSGKPFIVSNKDNAAILADMQSTEKLWFWITKGAAWFLIAGGLTAILGPIFAALDILPGLGGALRSIVFIINGAIAAVIVFLGTLVITYWYIALGGLILLVALLYMMKKKPTVRTA